MQKKEKPSEQTKDRLLYTGLAAAVFGFIVSLFFPNANILAYYGFVVGWLGYALRIPSPKIPRVGGSS